MCYLTDSGNTGYLGHDGTNLVVLSSPSGEKGKWILSQLYGSKYMIHTASGELLFLSHADGKVSLRYASTREEKWEALMGGDFINAIRTPEGLFLDIAAPGFLSEEGNLKTNVWKIVRV